VVVSVEQPVRLAELEEANVVGVLTEALTAQIQAVLANKSTALSADTAKCSERSKVEGEKESQGG
jgi:hypothetical protein